MVKQLVVFAATLRKKMKAETKGEMKALGIGFISRKLGVLGTMGFFIVKLPPEAWIASVSLCALGVVYIIVQGRLDAKKLEVEWAKLVTGQTGGLPKKGADIHPFTPPDATG
jgi:hypothetical protein